MKRLTLLILTLLILSSCVNKDRLVMHPDSPMLIEEVHWGNKVSVALYDKQNNRLVHYGKVKVPEGWTLHKFDWEKHIDKRKID